MSQGARLPHHRAAAIAEELVALLRQDCERIEIAGSIRRRALEVGDIELVAVPRMLHERTEGLFSEIAETLETDMLEARVSALIGAGELALRDVDIHRANGDVETGRRDGRAYKALVFRRMPVDLFIVRPPAEWGVIFAIRTGPPLWNIRLVSDCQRYFRRVQGGQLLHLGKPVPCPEERDFFAAIGQRWVDPPDRRPELVAIRPPVATA